MNVSRDLNVMWDFSVVGLKINKNQRLFQNFPKHQENIKPTFPKWRQNQENQE